MSIKSRKIIELEILEDLIIIYERRWYLNSNFGTRVSIKIEEKGYNKYFEKPELYDLILAELKEKEFIDVNKLQYRNINESFHLNLNKINEIYIYIDKVHPQIYLDRLIQTFDKYSCEINDLRKNSFFKIRNEKKSIRSYLTKDYIDIVKASYYIDTNEEETYERNFSNKVFNDSKRLEQLKGQIFNYFENDNILIEKGIIKNPTYLYIKGEGELIINNQLIDLSLIETSIGLPSTIISNLEFSNIKKVYSVENLTTFNYFEEEGLILYLGGFSNHHKIELLNKLKKHTTDFYHFGDIDYGGFSILNHLITNVNINIKAYNMSMQEVFKYKDRLIRITEDSYIDKLKTLLGKNNLKPYYDVINYLIANKVKLEQESIID